MVTPLPSAVTTVHVGAGCLAALPAQLAGRRVVALVDRRVLVLHGPLIRATLGRGATLLEVPAGEDAKTVAVASAIWERLAREELRRDDVVLAIGGGATLDLAGFVASTWGRGTPWVAVATTLLAQVDAGLGGKTALDLAHGKNLVGTFHPPEALFADPAFLATLPEREYRAALFEILKVGWLGDATLRRLAGSEALGRRAPKAVASAVRRSLRAKAALVARDPRDHGVRRLLNLGHTFAHALEAATGFRLRHGEAVGIGLLAAAHAARALGRLDGADLDRRRAEVQALLAPSRRMVRAALAGGSILASAVRAARLDKKRGAGRGPTLVLVLPTPGGAEIVAGVPVGVFTSALRAALRDLMAAPA